MFPGKGLQILHMHNMALSSDFSREIIIAALVSPESPLCPPFPVRNTQVVTHMNILHGVGETGNTRPHMHTVEVHIWDSLQRCIHVYVHCTCDSAFPIVI